MIILYHIISLIGSIIIDTLTTLFLFLLTFKIDSRDIGWTEYNYFNLTKSALEEFIFELEDIGLFEAKEWILDFLKNRLFYFDRSHGSVEWSFLYYRIKRREPLQDKNKPN